MHRILKVAHLIGLAVFLGSIPGHIVLGALGVAAEAAAGGIGPAAIASLAARESSFGAANLAMVVAVIALSVSRRPGVV